jgi:hypothetical protein
MRYFAILVLVACGGGDTDSPFVATWTYDGTGMQVMTCTPDDFNDTFTPTGSWELLAGSDADLETEADVPCPAILFDVSDRVATARTGQGCTDVEAGITRTTTYTSYTLTLDADGKKLTEAVQGTFTATGAVEVNCTLVRNTTSTRP